MFLSSHSLPCPWVSQHMITAQTHSAVHNHLDFINSCNSFHRYQGMEGIQHQRRVFTDSAMVSVIMTYFFGPFHLIAGQFLHLCFSFRLASLRIKYLCGTLSKPFPYSEQKTLCVLSWPAISLISSQKNEIRLARHDVIDHLRFQFHICFSELQTQLKLRRLTRSPIFPLKQRRNTSLP